MPDEIKNTAPPCPECGHPDDRHDRRLGCCVVCGCANPELFTFPTKVDS